jgi:hypothetical protein
LDVKAEIATGTVSRLSARFSAVTTISAIALSSPAVDARAAGGAGAGAAAGSARAAMENATDTALESNSATVLVIIFNSPETASRPFVQYEPLPSVRDGGSPRSHALAMQPHCQSLFQMAVPPQFGALYILKSHRGTHYSIS